MPVFLLRLFTGKNFPPNREIRFTADWRDDMGEAGPVTSLANGHIKIYEEISFIIEEHDQRLRESTSLYLTYCAGGPQSKGLWIEGISQMTVNLKDDIIKKHLVFPAWGTKRSISPFIEVHCGLESHFTEEMVDAQQTIANSDLSLEYSRQSTEIQASQLIDCLFSHQNSTDMSLETENDFKLCYDSPNHSSSESGSNESEMHPALQALSDSGWGEDDDGSGFLNLEFQTHSFHTVIMDTSVSDYSWDLTRSKTDE